MYSTFEDFVRTYYPHKPLTDHNSIAMATMAREKASSIFEALSNSKKYIEHFISYDLDGKIDEDRAFRDMELFFKQGGYSINRVNRQLASLVMAKNGQEYHANVSVVTGLTQDRKNLLFSLVQL